MQPILALPDLEGMSYPALNRADLRRIVPGLPAIADLSPDVREGVRVLMTSASRGCDAATVAALPALELVVSQGAGQDKIDKAALSARGIRLRSVGEAVTDDVADLAMTLVHMLLRHIPRADAFVRSGGWSRGRFSVTESAVGKVVGIAGLSGRIGQAISARARASRMTVAGLDRASNMGLADMLFPDWLSLAKASEVLILALPGNSDLTHVVNGNVLRQLGPTGILVNVARGNLVDTDALIDALETGTLGGAGLDVLEGEPDVPTRLIALPNIVLTPHVGAQTWGQRTRASAIAEAEILAFLGLNQPAT